MRRILVSTAQRALAPPSVGSPIPSDEFFDNVVLLLDFAGSDGATNISDLSNSAHNSETFVSTAQVDTGLQYLGENTLLLDGNSDRVDYPDSADWDLGNTWTIELGARSSNWGSNDYGLIGNDSGSAGWKLRYLGSTGNLEMAIWAGTIKDESWTPTNSVFHHIAVSKTGGDIYMFIDGVQLGTPTTQGSSLDGSADVLNIGAFRDTLQFFNGSIGAVRITKGVGRYTSNFTPPTEFYPTS